jgi:hypothetical protein
LTQIAYNLALRTGQSMRTYNLHSQNVVACAQLPKRINLDKMYMLDTMQQDYMPRNFPGLICRLDSDFAINEIVTGAPTTTPSNSSTLKSDSPVSDDLDRQSLTNQSRSNALSLSQCLLLKVSVNRHKVGQFFQSGRCHFTGSETLLEGVQKLAHVWPLVQRCLIDSIQLTGDIAVWSVQQIHDMMQKAVAKSPQTAMINVITAPPGLSKDKKRTRMHSTPSPSVQLHASLPTHALHWSYDHTQWSISNIRMIHCRTKKTDRQVREYQKFNTVINRQRVNARNDLDLLVAHLKDSYHASVQCTKTLDLPVYADSVQRESQPFLKQSNLRPLRPAAPSCTLKTTSPPLHPPSKKRKSQQASWTSPLPTARLKSTPTSVYNKTQRKLRYLMRVRPLASEDCVREAPTKESPLHAYALLDDYCVWCAYKWRLIDQTGIRAVATGQYTMPPFCQPLPGVYQHFMVPIVRLKLPNGSIYQCQDDHLRQTDLYQLLQAIHTQLSILCFDQHISLPLDHGDILAFSVETHEGCEIDGDPLASSSQVKTTSYAVQISHLGHVSIMDADTLVIRKRVLNSVVEFLSRTSSTVQKEHGFKGAIHANTPTHNSSSVSSIRRVGQKRKSSLAEPCPNKKTKIN